MTPGMSARDITFARRRTSIEGLLSREWWGERDRVNLQRPGRESSTRCAIRGSQVLIELEAPDKGIAQEMILRRREKQTLDALEDLVGVPSRRARGTKGRHHDHRRLAAVHAEPESRAAARKRTAAADAGDQHRSAQRQADERRTRRTRRATRSQLRGRSLRAVGAQRRAAHPDDLRRGEPREHVVLSDRSARPRRVRRANRADGGGRLRRIRQPDVAPGGRTRALVGRSNSLRDARRGTDGLAIVGTQQHREGLQANHRRPELRTTCSGYYSTGKLDGRFHSIRVRVKRPGVEVRARRGYLAPSAADVARGLPKAPDVRRAPGAENAIATAAAAAVATLPAAARDQPLRVHVTAGWRPAARRPAGSRRRPSGPSPRWPIASLEADLEALLTHRGEVVGSARGRIAPGAISLLDADRRDAAASTRATTQVRVRSQTPSGVETLTVPVTLPPPSSASGAVYMRRGPSSGNKDTPTADLRYRRSDRAARRGAVGGRRWRRRGCSIAPGSRLPVPVASAMRDDADGSRWATAELAPRAAGAGRLSWSRCRPVPRGRWCRFRLVPSRLQVQAVRRFYWPRPGRSSASTA